MLFVGLSSKHRFGAAAKPKKSKEADATLQINNVGLGLGVKIYDEYVCMEYLLVVGCHSLRRHNYVKCLLVLGESIFFFNK